MAEYPEEMRSYYLPAKLIKRLQSECQKSGLVRGRVVAAAIYRFMNSSPEERAAMFEALNKQLSRKR